MYDAFKKCLFIWCFHQKFDIKVAIFDSKDLKLFGHEWICHDWNCQQSQSNLPAYGAVWKIKSVVQTDMLIYFYTQQVIATTSLASPPLSPTLPSVAHLIHTNNSSAACKQTPSAESTDD